MAEEEEAVREEEEEKLRVQMACGVDFEEHTPAPEPGKVFAPPTLTGLESLVTLVTLVIRSPRSFLCRFTRSTHACTGEDNDRFWLMMSFAAFTPFGGVLKGLLSEPSLLAGNSFRIVDIYSAYS